MEETRHKRTMSETKAFPVDRRTFSIKPLFIIFILVIGTSMNANNASASVLNNYDPVEFVVQETPLNHFGVVESGIYVGGKNYIYHLYEDLSLHQTENTCSLPCDSNDNKILVVAPSPVNRLITCGSFNDGCELRKLSNISEAFQSIAPVTNTETPAVGVFVSGSWNFFVGVSPQFDPETSINYVSKWTVDPTDSSNQLKDHVQTNTPSSDARINNVEVKFRSGFVQSGFTYFITNQQQLEYDGANNPIPPADLPYVSKLNRVCQTSIDFDTFTDVPIKCSAGDGTSYNLIQAIDVSLPGRNLAEALSIDGTDALLYAVFAESGDNTDTPTANSALCIYNMTDVEDKFLKTIQNCLNRGSAYGSKLLNSRCLKVPISLEATREQECDTDNYQYASAPIGEPLEATAILQMDGTLATSIETAIEENETIAFIGSSTGELLKVHIGSATQARMYEEVSIDNTQVQQDTYFDQENDQLYMLTEQKLVRLSVANCSQYTTCDECIGQDGAQDGDPYCGWCTLEASCTRYRDCGRMDEPMRWLPYSAEQCINITSTSMGFSVPVSTPSQQINITMSQLPALSEGESYSCFFGTYSSEVSGIEGQQFSCTTPPQGVIPPIPAGQSYITVELSIYSSETSKSFYTTDFQFYDCSRISSCKLCMSSPWACDWCIYDNKCTHDNSTCQEGDTTISANDPNAAQKCPQILSPTKELLVPAGLSSEITLQASNLPLDQTKVQGYKCILTVEGARQETRATVDRDTVTCQPTVYTYASTDKKQIKSQLDVIWNSRNTVDDDDITVTLYKCGVDRESCSRCLSPSSTPPELQCAWCGNVCAVTGSESCTRSNVVAKMQNSSAVCGAPRITEIKPRSGPLEGNTLITVFGMDLGQSFGDIIRVMVGNAECSLAGMEGTYDAGRSVMCRTSRSPVGAVTASILVNTLNGTGPFKYEYVDPQIESFTPTRGLQAGGTQVTITGTYLNTGSAISFMFGNTSCIPEGSKTSTTVHCRTSASESTAMVPLTGFFDGSSRSSSDTFHFFPNPVVNAISRGATIVAGGLLIVVNGTGFGVVQQALIRTSVALDNGQSCAREEPCQLNNATTISCTSPPLPQSGDDCTTENPSENRVRRATDPGNPVVANMTFVFDGYTLSNASWRLNYYPNPIYYPFEDKIMEFSATNIIIKGKNLNLASTKNDVLVMVGDSNATVVSLATETLVFDPPKELPNLGPGENSTKNMRMVMVKHGTLITLVGHLDYSKQQGTNSEMMLKVIIGVVGGIILIIVLIIIVACITFQKRYQKRLEHVQMEMTNLEEAVKNEATKAFFDIQQDMSGIKDQLQDVGGMPFVTSQDYIRNMLFVGLDVQPMTQDPQRPEENLKKAMTEFAKLLNNKDFLLVFIRSLDEDDKLQMREKNNIASLLTVALVLEGKLSYLSEVMLTLMSESIQNAAESDRYRQLFKRTESIVEKLLANWMALCMYNYLQEHVAYPLYLLYQAIKFQIERGPIDVITGQCHFSLNYDYLLDENIEYKEVTLEVENKMQETETNHVKVLDVDTISQVKDKVLDALLRNKPQSERFTPLDVDLVLRSGVKGQLVLRDTDNTTEKPMARWAKVNTIEHYGINDNAKVAVVNKQDNPNASLATPLAEDTELLPSPSPKRTVNALHRLNTNVESDMEDGVQFCHLSPLYEDEASKKKKHRKIREIYLRRLVSTKKSIQTFVDDVLQAMLSVSAERPLPKALKYLFDFLDRQADRQKLKADTSELWKNSCLPLRFWVTALNHPAYVFDMNQTRTADTCITVLTQMLDNACKGIVPKYSFETSPSRVLYASELPTYIKMIPEFYDKVKEQPRVNQEEVDDEFRQVCEAFHGTFSNIGILYQLYGLTSGRNDTLVHALDDDEQCQRANMVHKWDLIGETLGQGGD